MSSAFFNSMLGELSFRINADNLHIRTDQLGSRLRIYPSIQLVQVLLELLFVLLFWDHAEHRHLLYWLAALFTLHGAATLLWWRYRAHINTIEQCRRWSRIFNWQALLVAALWGGIALWFFPQDLAYQALMICIVLGLASGAISLGASYPPAMYITVLGVTLPLLARLASISDKTHWILAGMMLLFIAGSLRAARQLNHIFWKSLHQRHENDYLVMQLIRQMSIAEKANQDKSRFLASASHDLRQPLQALVLFNESLKFQATDTGTLHLAGQMDKSLGALIAMFDELLDLSKFDSGVIKANKCQFPVQTVFDRLADEFTPLARAKNLELAVQQSTLSAFSDPHLLERILRNLISNAIRYTEAGQVNVGCQQAGGMLKFTVSDTGIGIPANQLPHIFEEYYQVGNKSRDRLNGLGLGLAIVRRMENLLGCAVAVQSEPGKGSSFSFSIAQSDTALMQHPPAAETGEPDLGGVIVALVDTDQDFRNMTAQMLKQWGCEVHDGSMPFEVLNRMAANGIRPDLLICDYQMRHEMTAIDAIRQLKLLWNIDIPTIILTADTNQQLLQEIQVNGAMHLSRPIAPSRLRDIIHGVLHKETGTAFR